MKTTEVGEIKKNIIGTVSFWMKTSTMRKIQEFIVCPERMGDDDNKIIIQSETRIGTLDMIKNEGEITKSYPNGAYYLFLLQTGKTESFVLKENDLKRLKLAIVEIFCSRSCRTDAC